MAYCENCGCKEYNGTCTNCHEEIYIMDQYYQMDEELEHPLSDEFIDTVKKQKEEVKRKKATS